MARLRILWLPFRDETAEIPFALIVDDVAPLRYIRGEDLVDLPSDVDQEEAVVGAQGWTWFGEQVGARAVLVTTDRVDVVDEDVEDDDLTLRIDSETFTQSVAEALREHLGPVVGQKVNEWAAQVARDQRAERQRRHQALVNRVLPTKGAS